MNIITVDISKSCGKMKPMHSVNNGPVYKFAEDQRITNIDAYRDAGIPYARNHDAAFNATYGGEHIVDVHAIFPDFDKDPYDENSYDFVLTDEYLKIIDFAGTKIFYRLGSKIEHQKKKYGTLPPKDFYKWAVICEHIIRHYNYGWADGFHYNIEYWEIWNEPDLDEDDSTNKRNWGGTAEQFYKFYNIAAKHLKQTFPELKIGGPASCGVWRMEWLENFFKSLEVKPDFFSWHIYANDMHWFVEKVRRVRELLDKYGLYDTESILNEWNYVKGWTGDDWLYSLKQIKGIKGAAFTASAMCACQYEKLDHLMYYDARPCAMNGMFCTDWVCECLKGYYPFRMFNELYKLKNCVGVSSDNADIYPCAAVSDDEKQAAVMFAYFNDDDNAPSQSVRLSADGLPQGAKAEIYLLDSEHDMELVREESIGKDGIVLDMPLYGVYLIKINM